MGVRGMNENRIKETAELIAKLHLLDDKELMFVAGTVAALSITKKIKKNKTNDNNKVS